MTRFFAHLCLYLQLIDIAVSPLAIQIILEAYLQVLEVRPYLYLFAVSNLPLTDCVDRARASVPLSLCTPVLWVTTPLSAMPSS